MVNKITFQNYKSFKEKQELSLKPITVLIGKNSSGKSAISKLLALLSGSLSGEFEPPLNWQYKGIRLGLSNSDLFYNKSITSILKFQICSEKEELEVSLSIDRKDKPEILEWKLNNNPANISQERFKGFKSEKINYHLNIPFDYIGPIREIPRPNYTRTFDSFKTIGITGANAYSILIQDSEDAGELIKQVSKWYEENFEGWKIEILQIPAPETTFQIVLSNKRINQINIVNVGQGMNQALPLIVRSYMKDNSPVRIIIEEPETHLHPSAHGNLAERFADSYISDTKKNYLIETHSQNFILRLRKLVAQQKLNIKDLAIYYVDFNEDTNESSLQLITVGQDGGVDWWPDGIFSETLNETRAIRDVQLSAIKNVD